MSGPEWTPEPADPRVEDRPLSPDVDAGHGHDHDHDDQGSDGPEAAPPRQRRGFGLPPLSFFLGLLPSLGSERHEAMPDAPYVAAPAGSAHAADPAEAPARRPSPRSRLMGLKRETRFGLAMFLSFAFLSATLVVQKGWLGKAKAPPVFRIENPAGQGQGDPPPPPADPKLLASATPTAPEKGDITPPPAAAPPRAGKGDALPPADPKGSRARLAGSDRPAEPAPPPATDRDDLSALTLANMGPPAGPPQSPPSAPPEPSQPPPAAPPATTDAPLDLPGDPPSAPASSPAPAADPAPSGLPAMPTEAPPPAPEPAANALPAMPGDQPKAPSATPPAGPTPDPFPTPAPAIQPPPTDPAPEPSPSKLPEAAGPKPATGPFTLESVPSAAVPAAEAAPAGSTAAALGPGWVLVKSGGKKVLGSDAPSAAPAPAQDGPPARDDAAVADQIEPALHTVLPGENFWTISKLYYRSSRYYQALHAANRNQVPDIRKLYVGTVLRIPPPETLDRALIAPPGRPSATDGPAVSRASRRAEPTDEIVLSRPIRPQIPREEDEAPAAPRRPTYRVKSNNETLRSIARDTLDDSRRYREILNLNRDTIDDPRAVLAPGMTLTLPEDAVIGRRAR